MQRTYTFITAAMALAFLTTTAVTDARAGERVFQADPKIQNAIKPKITILQPTEQILVLPRPDLRVAPSFAGSGPLPSSGYCGLVAGQTQLFIKVKNTGNATSGPTSVKVDFGQYGVQIAHVNAPIGSGAARTAVVPMPASLPETWPVNFTVTVDPTNGVLEHHENNNAGTGQCAKVLSQKTGDGRS
ncbi:MAG: CARDB domain-containing protein [Pseudomonadota bacterium]